MKLRGGFLEVGLPDPADPKAVRRVLDRWYRDQSKVRFAKQLREAHARMKAHEIPEPRLRLLRMAKRWGSCTPAGEILLNPDLVKAPAPCIDNVDPPRTLPPETSEPQPGLLRTARRHPARVAEAEGPIGEG